MEHGWRKLLRVGIVLAGIPAVALAAATPDVTASYDGTLNVRRTGHVASVAGALKQLGVGLTGTLAIDMADPGAGGVYWVSGRMHGKTIRLRGANGAGTTLRWQGRTRARGIRGRTRLQGASGVTKGLLVLVRRDGSSPPSPPAACADAFFRDEVMAHVLVPICGSCHVPGGLAEATSFRVTAADPLATLASASLQVDAAQPSASRILRKPLAELPHGGGQQIVPGSAEHQTLEHWVNVAVQGGCAGGGGGGAGGGTGADLYTTNCASCHGPDARGVGGRPSIRCKSTIVEPVRTGRGNVMPSFPNLTDAAIAAIQAYLAGLCIAAGGENGADLYASNCTSCHGADAGGGENWRHIRSPEIRCTGTGDILEKVRNGDGQMPAFPGITTDQISLIAAYVHGFCTNP